MKCLVKFFKDGKWSSTELTLPDEMNIEIYVEKNFSKDFIIYKETIKSKERLRKEEIAKKGHFDLLRY